MQVKPRFDSFRILEQIPIKKDDRGNEMCLTLFEVKLRSTSDELVISPYKFYSVVGRNQEIYNNKAVAYSDCAFWRAKRATNLYKDTINNIVIEEVECGKHCMFATNYFEGLTEDDFGVKTRFIIKQKDTE